jgi:hypothetical protein
MFNAALPAGVIAQPSPVSAAQPQPNENSGDVVGSISANAPEENLEA